MHARLTNKAMRTTDQKDIILKVAVSSDDDYRSNVPNFITTTESDIDAFNKNLCHQGKKDENDF